MAGPLVAAQAAPAAAQSAVKILTTDLVKVSGKVYRRIRFKEPAIDRNGRILLTKTGRYRMRTAVRFEPIDIDLHVNPIGIGVLGIVATFAGFALFGQLDIPGPLGPITLYRGIFRDEFEAFKGGNAQAKAACELGGGTWSTLRQECIFPATTPATIEEECSTLHTLYLANIPTVSINALAQAKGMGCAWTEGL